MTGFYCSVQIRSHFAKTIFTNQSRNTVFLKAEFAPIFINKCVKYFDTVVRGFLQILIQSPLFKNETESENNYPPALERCLLNGLLKLPSHNAREITRVKIYMLNLYPDKVVCIVSYDSHGDTILVFQTSI